MGRLQQVVDHILALGFSAQEKFVRKYDLIG